MKDLTQSIIGLNCSDYVITILIPYPIKIQRILHKYSNLEEICIHNRTTKSSTLVVNLVPKIQILHIANPFTLDGIINFEDGDGDTDSDEDNDGDDEADEDNWLKILLSLPQLCIIHVCSYDFRLKEVIKNLRPDINIITHYSH